MVGKKRKRDKGDYGIHFLQDLEVKNDELSRIMGGLAQHHGVTLEQLKRMTECLTSEDFPSDLKEAIEYAVDEEIDHCPEDVLLDLLRAANFCKRGEELIRKLEKTMDTESEDRFQGDLLVLATYTRYSLRNRVVRLAHRKRAKADAAAVVNRRWEELALEADPDPREKEKLRLIEDHILLALPKGAEKMTASIIAMHIDLYELFQQKSNLQGVEHIECHRHDVLEKVKEINEATSKVRHKYPKFAAQLPEILDPSNLHSSSSPEDQEPAHKKYKENVEGGVEAEHMSAEIGKQK